MRRPHLLAFLASPALFAAGCGSELGSCDQEAAVEMVYGRSNLVATAGQALTHDSCSNGAFCHSSRAEGKNRIGAPKELDFDMLPEPIGWFVLRSYREEAWRAVEDESMPPPEAGSRVLGDGDWRYDVDRAESSPRLPSIRSAEGKEILRNWLACGAPTVDETIQPLLGAGGRGAPPDDSEIGGGGEAGESGSGGEAPPIDAGDETPPIDSGADAEPEPEPPDWGPVFAEIIEPNCATAGCHDSQSKAGEMQMTDECGALEALLATGPCKTVRVTPGDADSFLLEKLKKQMPSCGSRMPLLAPLPAGDVARIAAWIEAGAHSSRCD